jgi:hypothetical protein
VGIMDPVGDGELGGVGGLVLAEDAEHAAGFDGAVLGGIADEAQAGTRLPGEPAQSVEVAVGDGGGLVDDEDGAGVEGGGVGAVVGRDTRRVSRWACRWPRRGYGRPRL